MSFLVLFFVILCIVVQALVLPAGSDPLTLGTHTAPKKEKREQRYNENRCINKTHTQETGRTISHAQKIQCMFALSL